MQAQTNLGTATNGIGDRISSHLDKLSPTLQGDYVAVVENDVSPSTRADQRDVNASTVCTNVKRATKQLVEHWREEHGATPESSDTSNGYDIELVPVGGSNSDGSGVAIGKYTFQAEPVKKRVCDHLSGRVLNACAGETILPHENVHRNDANPDRPQLDTTYDVTENISSKFDHLFDAIIFDPPFSQQNSEKFYEGWHVSSIAAARDELTELVAPGGVFIECGWSSHSVSSWSGWEPGSMYLFQRGPTIPDMFLTCDVKVQQTLI